MFAEIMATIFVVMLVVGSGIFVNIGIIKITNRTTMRKKWFGQLLLWYLITVQSLISAAIGCVGTYLIFNF
jgi:hypothetical protein